MAHDSLRAEVTDVRLRIVAGRPAEAFEVLESEPVDVVGPHLIEDENHHVIGRRRFPRRPGVARRKCKEDKQPEKAGDAAADHRVILAEGAEGLQF